MQNSLIRLVPISYKKQYPPGTFVVGLDDGERVWDELKPREPLYGQILRLEVMDFLDAEGAFVDGYVYHCVTSVGNDLLWVHLLRKEDSDKATTAKLIQTDAGYPTHLDQVTLMLHRATGKLIVAAREALLHHAVAIRPIYEGDNHAVSD